MRKPKKISLPETSTLTPQMVGTVRVFKSTSTDLVRIDLIHEAGYAYQQQPLQAAAACKLCTMAAGDMDARQMAEFKDFRGIAVENDVGVLQSDISVYMLRRYADEAVPMVADMMQKPLFSEDDLRTWLAKRRHELMAAEQRTDMAARRLYYETLFGTEHPLGRYANASDTERLGIEAVRTFFAERYADMTAMVLSGNADEELINLLDKHSLTPKAEAGERLTLQLPSEPPSTMRVHKSIEGAVQTTVRIGCVVPLAWDSLDFALLKIAVMALGGHFGSRLMSNLREDKGYTYGIYANTQISRGVIVFYITADVAGGCAEDAISEIRKELQRLCSEPMNDEELRLVLSAMVGDSIRAVDGVFEKATRCAGMIATDVDERMSDALLMAMTIATPEQIRSLAEKYLNPDRMVVCTAGV